MPHQPSQVTNITNLELNTAPPLYMHIDLNAAFASIEQLANPLLRGRPVAVGARQSPNGCLVAVSYQAKTYGIKTGTRVHEALQRCPHLIICSPDSNKYRAVHKQFIHILNQYSPSVTPKSIDEAVVDFAPIQQLHANSLIDIAHQIKHDLRTQIGPPITASIGIGTNRFLAKLAAGLQKPDGLTVINSENLNSKLENLQLTDLPGIANAMETRLKRWNITTPLEFLQAPSRLLEKQVFGSINGFYWYLRLRGWEVDTAPTQTRTIGHSYMLHRPSHHSEELLPILLKLTTRVSTRLRKQSYQTNHLHLQLRYQQPPQTLQHKHNYRHSSFYRHQSTPYPLQHTHELYNLFTTLFSHRDPKQTVTQIAIITSDLTLKHSNQLYLIPPITTKLQKLVTSLNQINDQYGEFTVYPVRMHPAVINQDAPDRIGFGRVKEL